MLESVDEPDVPVLPVVPPLVLLLVPDALPGDVVMSLPPLLPLLESEDPEEEPLLVGCSIVVVVVVTASLLPEVDPAPGDAALSAAGSFVVVVVVVVCPNVAVAVPSSDRKMARGNFFMPAPSFELMTFFKKCNGKF